MRAGGRPIAGRSHGLIGYGGGRKRERRLDGSRIDLSPETAFGVDGFPESTIACRAHFGFVRPAENVDDLVSVPEKKSFGETGPDGSKE